MVKIADSQQLLKLRMESLADDIQQLKAIIKSADISLSISQEFAPVKIKQFEPDDQEKLLKRRVPIS